MNGHVEGSGRATRDSQASKFSSLVIIRLTDMSVPEDRAHGVGDSVTLTVGAYIICLRKRKSSDHLWII